MTALGRQHLLDLLADRATQPLDAEEQTELDRLLGDFPDEDADALDFTAALIDLTLAKPREPLPASVSAKIQANASEVLREATRGAPVIPISAAVRRDAPAWREAVAWVAAAASIAFLIFSFPPESPVRPGEQRDALIASAPDLIRVDWSATGDAAGPDASGDVVWSNERQAGFMRFRGLAANDPSESQYQLWIFDATRPEAHPVDGGVFDVAPATGDVIVPIQAKLPVFEPTLFAVTVEKPGGVVVSSRERLPLLAKVES